MQMLSAFTFVLVFNMAAILLKLQIIKYVRIGRVHWLKSLLDVGD